MGITRKLFGTDGTGAAVERFKLTNHQGAVCEITNYGGAIISLYVPDRQRILADIVLGFDTLEGYVSDTFFMGAIIGRCANRIAEASFTLNGRLYPLDKNFGRHHMHGGFKGFHKAVWQAIVTAHNGSEVLELSYHSPDGEGGYPGNLDVKVTYFLAEDNSLIINQYAISNQDTIVNLTNHPYFNLAGHDSGDVLEQVLTIRADRFVVIDSESMPTGELRFVAGTPMDFRNPAPIGRKIHENDIQLRFGCGYDHNYALAVGGIEPEKVADCYDPKSGRALEVLTTMPGLQLYTSNKLDAPNGKSGAYGKWSGVCLETQYYPDSPHHPGFPSPILRAGKEYKQSTIYRFSTRDG